MKQKHLKFGIEFELFTLDSGGNMIDGADRLIAKVKELYPDIPLAKECGKNMIEITSKADPDVTVVINRLLNNLERILYVADKEGIVLYPFGTYPSSFTPTIRSDKHYKVQEQIFGKKRFSIAGRCIGFHCHYSLPWGVFDVAEKIVKSLVYSKHKQSMVNVYNLFIAMDPALTTFTQSSPFYQGKFLGKDSRVIVYRGGEVLNYPQGLYAPYQHFGMLPPYKYTGTDLVQLIKRRFDEWVKILTAIDLNIRTISKYGSMLDTSWNPVKINAHGTTEQRGMDMNSPRITIALAIMIYYLTKDLQENFVQVIPSDIAVAEPFKREGNIIYIPPHTHVRHHLQKKAAFKGLEDKEVLAYCSAVLRLAKPAVPKNLLPLLGPLDEILKSKKTTSDIILEEARSMGVSLRKKMSNDQAARLSLKLSRNLLKDVVLAKHAIQRIT